MLIENVKTQGGGDMQFGLQWIVSVITIFRDVMPCNLVEICRCREGTHCLRLHMMFLMFVDRHITVQFIKKNPTRCNNVSKFHYSIFIWSSTCFGQHTTHHQGPKTAMAASDFSHVEGCWTCSWWTSPDTVWAVPDNVHQLHVQQPCEKPEAASAVLGSWWWAVCRPKHVELHINTE